MIKPISEMTLTEKIDAAFLQASHRVLEIARQKKTQVAISRNGQVVLLYPDEIVLPEIELILDMPKDQS